ncbi:MAG TPA: hypothetical protein VJ883_04430 [Woeseiaceae bacterium]|nr:hypothetical protein [Woeseiaceae bacterium]
MKYVLSLLAGLILGATLVLLVLYYNPLTRDNPRVPLTGAPDASVEVFYGTAADTVARTGPAEGVFTTVPTSLEALWEPALAGTEARVLALRDVDGRPLGFGVRFAALHSGTRPLNGDLLAASVWNIHLAGRGSLFVDGLDNLWPLARHVLVPAWRADDGTWQGRFAGDLTVGPRPSHVAVMTGGAGVFAGTRGEARESLAVQSFSLREGRVQADGSLLVAIIGSTEGSTAGGRVSPE